MNSSFDFDVYTAEVEYRADRIRRGVGRNRRKVRLPFAHHEEGRRADRAR